MKRRFLLTLGALLTLASAVAQISTTPTKLPDYNFVWWIPMEFTDGPKYQFFLTDMYYNDNGDEPATIYDENLSIIRTIKCIDRPEVLQLTSPELYATEGAYHPVVFTQTLFNNDPYYEYVLLSKSDEHDDLYPTYTGFRVVNENGKQVTSVSFESPIQTRGGIDMELIMMGDKRYIVVKADYSYFYAIDADTSSINRIAEPMKNIVRPGIAKRSEPVTVTLEPGESDRQILVTSVNGTSFIHKNVSAGAESVTIDTTSLPQGMYVVSIVENGKSTENCKIIIR